MPSLTTPIQQSIGSPYHSNQTTKRNERHTNRTGGNETVTAFRRMIVYVENPIESTKKILDLINEFGKTAGYKVNTQKLKAFLYTNNETAETEIRKKKSHSI